MKIGLFGGTFNPVHRGHLIIARELLDHFPLDKIILVPSADPPHKGKENLVRADKRYEMTCLAAGKSNRITVSDIELKREGLSYSVDTIKDFAHQFGKQTDLYFITGIDAFIEINTWKSYMEILKTIPFIIAQRPGPWQNNQSGFRNILSRFLEKNISKQYHYNQDRNCFSHKEFKTIYLFRSSMVGISSSCIRKRIMNNETTENLLPEDVERYIKKGKLYI